MKKAKTAAQLDREIAAAQRAAHNPKGWKQRPAQLHWEVKAIVPNARGAGVGYVVGGFSQSCGHRHATRDEAIMCPWTPDPWPRQCDLIVAQVRTPDAKTRREQGKLF